MGMKESEASIDDLDLVIPTLEEIDESLDAEKQPEVEKILPESHKTEEAISDPSKKTKGVKSKKIKKETSKAIEGDDTFDMVAPTVDELDIQFLDEESEKPKDIKEKSSKPKLPKQGKKGKPNAFEAAIVSAGEAASEASKDEEGDSIVDLIVPTKDEIQVETPSLDTDESAKKTEIKEKSKKPKIPKQGKKAKPSTADHDIVFVEDTALE